MAEDTQFHEFAFLFVGKLSFNGLLHDDVELSRRLDYYMSKKLTLMISNVSKYLIFASVNFFPWKYSLA